jgi:gentisate 1,2-dioxygenase
MAVQDVQLQAPTSADREAWGAAHVTPLWEIAQAHAQPPVPRGQLWAWRTMEPLIQRAVELASPQVAERRVLSMIAPNAKPGEFHTMTNLNAAYQILLPGEVARPHRHSMDALRFVLRGSGAVTRVDGKLAAMAEGDLVITPGNCWHEHWHEGTAPIVWLDVLNVHTHLHLDTMTFEPGPVHDVPDLGDEVVFRYPLADALAQLEHAPVFADGARGVRYVNPRTGGPVMPYLDCYLVRIEAGQTTLPTTSSAHAMCAVVSGEGETRIGEQQFAWEQNDVFSLPSNVPIFHRARTAALVFVVTDRELYRTLGMLQEKVG